MPPTRPPTSGTLTGLACGAGLAVAVAEEEGEEVAASAFCDAVTSAVTCAPFVLRIVCTTSTAVGVPPDGVTTTVDCTAGGGAVVVCTSMDVEPWFEGGPFADVGAALGLSEGEGAGGLALALADGELLEVAGVEGEEGEADGEADADGDADADCDADGLAEALADGEPDALAEALADPDGDTCASGLPAALDAGEEALSLRASSPLALAAVAAATASRMLETLIVCDRGGMKACFVLSCRPRAESKPVVPGVLTVLRLRSLGFRDCGFVDVDVACSPCWLKRQR